MEDKEDSGPSITELARKTDDDSAYSQLLDIYVKEAKR